MRVLVLAVTAGGVATVEVYLLIRTETVHNATFFQIIRRHLNFDAITGQNAYAIDAHAPCQRAVQHMILRLGTKYFDAKRGIWKGFFNHADEFYNVLRH